MSKKLPKKTRPRTVTIRMDNVDFTRLDWLRTFLGGGNASSALKFALKAAYEQQKALQRTVKYDFQTVRPCAIAGCEKMATPGCFGCGDHGEEIG